MLAQRFGVGVRAVGGHHDRHDDLAPLGILRPHDGAVTHRRVFHQDVFDLGGIVGAIIVTMILLGIVGFVMRRTGAPRQATIGEAQRTAARGERSAARERRRDRPR